MALAIAAIDKIRPSNKAAIDQYANAVEPEIVSAREVFIHRRQCDADIIADAICEGVREAERRAADAEALVDYAKRLGLHIAIGTSTDCPEGRLMHEFIKGSTLDRMFEEWSHSIGWEDQVAKAESAAKELRDVLRHIDKAKADSPERLVEKIKTLAYRAITPAPTPESDEPADTLPANARFVEVEKPHPDSLRLDWLQANMPFGAAIGWDDADYYFACSPDGKVHCGDSLQLRSALDAAMSAPSAKGGES